MRTIFVSSTFRDMQAERDAIRDICAPKLNEEARKHGDEIDFCDLRWGIDTAKMGEEESSLKVLDVCFNQIDRCQPPFVILSGYRYGWIPEADIVSKAVRNRDLDLDDLEKSVTALEIEYGAFRSSRETLVYIREIVDERIPGIYDYEDAERKKKLEALRNRIAKLPNAHARTYQVHFTEGKPSENDIESFAHMLTEDLTSILSKDWQSYDALTPFERMVNVHWNYVHEKSAMFTARKKDAEKCLALLEEGNRQTVLVSGASGSGKSTLLSYVGEKLREKGNEVLPVISGLTPEATDSLDVLAMIEQYLIHLTGMRNENDGDRKAEDYQKRVVELASLLTKRVYILIDAADQLYADTNRDQMIFIPSGISENVRFLITCTKDLKTDIPPAMALEELNRENRVQVMDGVLGYVQKELGSSAKDYILDYSSAVFPLSVALMVQRLCIMDVRDFDVINSSKEEANRAIAEQQKKLISEMPDDLPSLSRAVFEEVGKRIDEKLTKKVREYIAISRYGLRVSDLITLCGNEWSSLNFAHYINYLNTDFLVRNDGRYDFMHKSIRQGILAGIEDKDTLNRDICALLDQLDENDPVRSSEYVYHLMKNHAWNKVHTFIQNGYTKKRHSDLYKAAENMHDLALKEGEEIILSYIVSLKGNRNNVYDYFYLADILEKRFGESKQQSILYCRIMEKLYETMKDDLPSMTRNNRTHLVEQVCINLNVFANTAEETETGVRYAKILLDFAKEEFNPELMEEKVRLFTAYYHRVWSLKSISNPEILTMAAADGNEGLKLVDESFREYCIKNRIATLSYFYGCMGEIYTRLNDPVNTEIMYAKDRELRTLFLEGSSSDYSKMLYAGSCINMFNAEMIKENPDREKALSYVLEAVEIFDTTPVPKTNEEAILGFKDQVYYDAAAAKTTMCVERTEEEELQIITWYLKAFNACRTGFRKYAQVQFIDNMELTLNNLKNFKLIGSLNKASVDYVREKVTEWLEEDKTFLVQEASVNNYRLLQRDTELIGTVLCLDEKNYPEAVEYITAAIEKMEPDASLDPMIRSMIRADYLNLFDLDKDPDRQQKKYYALAMKLKNAFPTFSRQALEDINNSYAVRKDRLSKFLGFCYTNELYEFMQEYPPEDEEGYDIACVAAANRCAFMMEARQWDPRVMEYNVDYSRLLSQFEGKMSEELMTKHRDLQKKQAAYFLGLKPDENSRNEYYLRAGAEDYSQSKIDAHGEIFAKALARSPIYVPFTGDTVIKNKDSVNLFACSFDAQMYYYERDKVLIRTEKASPAGLTALTGMDQFVFILPKATLTMSSQEMLALMKKYGFNPYVPSHIEVDVKKSADHKTIANILAGIKDKKLILRSEKFEIVFNTLKQYKPAVNAADVIAMLDCSRKSFFKTEPNYIFFTVKAIESTFAHGKHIEYEKIQSVELKNKQLVFKYKTGLSVTMEYDDPDGTVRKIINGYLGI